MAEKKDRAGPFTVSEFTVLVRNMREDGLPQAIIDLIEQVGGQKPRDSVALTNAIKACALLGSRIESKRDIDSVKPHPNALDDPSVRGTVRAKPTVLDTSLASPRPRRKK